jgi:hypothetical protein
VGNDVGGRPEAVQPEKTRKFQKYVVKVNNYQNFLLKHPTFFFAEIKSEHL